MPSQYLLGWALTVSGGLIAGACFMHWYMTRGDRQSTLREDRRERVRRRG